MIGLLRRLVDPRERLLHTLARADLPTLPSAHLRVLQALRSDRSLPDVGRELALDPALTSAVLRTVNSAAFGLRRKVADASHAASLLGRAELETLVLGMGVVATSPRDPPGLRTEDFWRTSARRAVTARALADHVAPRDRSACFTAGLLQDMALPLLCQARPAVYMELLASHDHADLAAHERAALGVDHAEVAGWLAEHWRFPENLAMALRTHHAVGEGPPPVVVAGLLAHDEEDAWIEETARRVGVGSAIVAQAIAEGRALGDDLAAAILR